MILLNMRNNLSPLPSHSTVETLTDEVRSLLSRVKLCKSVGPDGIFHRILKGLSNYITVAVVE